ncbi:hypothetical protein T4D_14135 [Trichinella pseudospiralis]|uniref:Uncharacterized protein n=1 Tax=Trichinella pseudospiralis TaxID=6337 RepID=A0A0V1F6J0_TRIPS|nr:hypothetical protein T4D_5543 [Trichinella pseudospiralis]KRY82532.1 hypothetical protein T4D_685 [Trichinella pseudospiralis]KRY86035.1 hypothetical protein T4D_14135 [Trichinella pseudospiralis]
MDNLSQRRSLQRVPQRKRQGGKRFRLWLRFLPAYLNLTFAFHCVTAASYNERCANSKELDNSTFYNDF